MSEVALFNNAAVPAFARNAAPSALSLAMAGSSGESGKRISIKGGVFRLLHDGKEVAQIEERSIHVVVVNAAPKVGRILYLKKYDPDTAARPDCWSSDGNTPDAAVAAPQHENCMECPQNVKGSGEGDSKKCRYQQQLAVVPVFDDVMDDDAMGLSLPALSLFGKEENGKYPMQAYARFLAAQNISPDMLLTEVRFDTKAESPKLFFKPKRWLTDAEYAKAQEIGQSPEALSAVEVSYSSAAPAPKAPVLPGKRPTKVVADAVDEDDDEDEVVAAPPPAPKKRKAVAAPAPVVADDDEDEDEDEVVAAPAPAPAPRKRSAAAAPVPETPSKPSLASLAAAWDDEDDDEDD